MKIRTVGTKLFHAGRQAAGRTDGHEEAKVRFSQFFEHAKKAFWLLHFCDQIQAKL
jgi:hypothetical protein